MAFDQSPIATVTPSRWGAELVVSWTSSAPAGSTYQIYLSRHLAWHGKGLACVLPWPSGVNDRIDVGVVPASEAETDWSASLPVLPIDRVTLAWLGGTYEATDLAGFRVYGSTAGGAVDYATPLADLPAYPGGIVLDGWNMGGWNQGGWNHAASSYSWESDPLTSGVWTFGVAAYDKAGNEDPAPPEVSATISVPPQPPAADARGVRLRYSYSAVSHIATLSWLASPG